MKQKIRCNLTPPIQDVWCVPMSTHKFTALQRVGEAVLYYFPYISCRGVWLPEGNFLRRRGREKGLLPLQRIQWSVSEFS